MIDMIEECYFAVDFVWRNRQEHTEVWENGVNAQCSPGAQVQGYKLRTRVCGQADQLVLIMEILDKKAPGPESRSNSEGSYSENSLDRYSNLVSIATATNPI
jgi:hypothetical protein